MTRNWADLPPELLSLIAQKIHLYKDFFFFGLVCKPFQSVTSSISNFHGPEPTRCLLLAGNEEADDECSLLGLVKGLTTKLVLPEIKGKRCFESLGWLLTIAGNGAVRLLNPFTRVQISLPSVYGLPRFRNESGDVGANLSVISKMVLSSNHSETENYMVIVIYCTCDLMSFWKAGDSNWTSVITPSYFRIGHLYDILYYDDQLYYVDHHRTVYCHDIRRGPHACTWKVGKVELDLEDHRTLIQSYLVEGDPGEILLVLHEGIDMRFDETRIYGENLNIVLKKGVTRFKVFACNSLEWNASSPWVEKTSLGNRALFLGRNASVSVDTTRLPGVKPNCIYYTDDFWPSYHQFAHPSDSGLAVYNPEDGTFETISRIDQLVSLTRKNMVIYHMEEGTMDTLFDGESVSRNCQPIWVTPSCLAVDGKAELPGKCKAPLSGFNGCCRHLFKLLMQMVCVFLGELVVASLSLLVYAYFHQLLGNQLN